MVYHLWAADMLEMFMLRVMSEVSVCCSWPEAGLPHLATGHRIHHDPDQLTRTSCDMMTAEWMTSDDAQDTMTIDISDIMGADLALL
jgi:hypothetical protein